MRSIRDYAELRHLCFPMLRFKARDIQDHRVRWGRITGLMYLSITALWHHKCFYKKHSTITVYVRISSALICHCWLSLSQINTSWLIKYNFFKSNIYKTSIKFLHNACYLCVLSIKQWLWLVQTVDPDRHVVILVILIRQTGCYTWWYSWVSGWISLYKIVI